MGYYLEEHIEELVLPVMQKYLRAEENRFGEDFELENFRKMLQDVFSQDSRRSENFKRLVLDVMFEEPENFPQLVKEIALLTGHRMESIGYYTEDYDKFNIKFDKGLSDGF